MSICEKLPSHAFSYFYFDFNDSAKQQVENLLRCIIKQLCFGREKLSDMIEKMHIQHGKGRALSLQTLLAAFVSALDDLESAYIIIDALDECTERDKLLDLLIDIAERKIKKLHVLVTSRKERGIQIALDSIVLGNISLDSSKVDDDITLHVRQRIKKSRQLNRWSDEVKLEIETTLVDGAHGMYVILPFFLAFILIFCSAKVSLGPLSTRNIIQMPYPCQPEEGIKAAAQNLGRNV